MSKDHKVILNKIAEFVFKESGDLHWWVGCWGMESRGEGGGVRG